MSETKVVQLTEDIKEWKRLAEQAERPRIRDVISIEIRKLETELIAEKEKEDQNKSTDTAKKPTQSIRSAYDVQVKNYSWDQSDKFVKIYLSNLKNANTVSEENLVSNFNKNSVNVRVQELDGKNHVFSIKETPENINPEKSYVKTKSDMVVIFLSKETVGTKWDCLRASEKAAEKKFSPPKMDKDADPSASIMNLMKQMYDDGDDDMKRTIAKAWTESRDGKGGGGMPGMPGGF